MTIIGELHARLLKEIRGETGRSERKLANNTYGRIEGNPVVTPVIIRYHQTDIAWIAPHGATYRTGGWWTYTTKERINRYLPQGWTLGSDHGVWWLTERVNDGMEEDGYPKYKWHRRSQFYNEIWLASKGDGAYVAAPRIDDPDAELRKQINAYAKLYTRERIDAILAYARENGLTGDCLYCTMPADAPFGTDHLALHVEEGYTMVSLALNALTEKGYPTPLVILEFDAVMVQRAVKTYMQKRLLHRERSAA